MDYQLPMGSRTGVDKVGVWVALATAALTLVTFAIAVMTPPLSGPLCVAEHCYSYPYTDIASRFPRDYLWIYPAMVLELLYVGLFACVYEFASHEKRVYGLFGLSAALMSATTLLVDYYIQIAVIQPSLLAGESDGIPILTQYNAHGVFIVLEELGYLLMGVSFVCIAPVFSKKNRLEKALRWLLGGGFLLIVIALIVISLQHGLQREYRFEIAAISIDWLVLIPASILMGLVFRRDRP